MRLHDFRYVILFGYHKCPKRQPLLILLLVTVTIAIEKQWARTLHFRSELLEIAHKTVFFAISVVTST